MNMFFRRGINEYQRQIALKDSFAIQTERLRDVFESVKWTNFDELPTNRRALRRRFSLLLLAPLVEIAWADGRVSRRESDLILQVAESYGLIKDDTAYCELLEKMTSRPVPQIVGRMWQDLNHFYENLSESERQTVSFCLTVQAQFVAEQSSDNLIAFLRGERVSQREREALTITAEQLKKAETAADLREKKRNDVLAREKAANEKREKIAPFAPVAVASASADYFGDAEIEATMEDYGRLIPLVPLVKTAWAEGRVTRRERHLIFEAAARMDIKPGTSAHRRLTEWLELHPTAEFYDHALDILQMRWKTLDADEVNRHRFDLLSDCTRVAEASGGTKSFASGGAKICDEEIAVVKHIAKKLNVNVAASSAVAN
jgi:uncharacterized tellurite resistance protein B-like protein